MSNVIETVMIGAKEFDIKKASDISARGRSKEHNNELNSKPAITS